MFGQDTELAENPWLLAKSFWTLLTFPLDTLLDVVTRCDEMLDAPKYKELELLDAPPDCNELLLAIVEHEELLAGWASTGAFRGTFLLAEALSSPSGSDFEVEELADVGARLQLGHRAW